MIHGNSDIQGSVTNTLKLRPGEYVDMIRGLSTDKIVAIQICTNFGMCTFSMTSYKV